MVDIERGLDGWDIVSILAMIYVIEKFIMHESNVGMRQWDILQNSHFQTPSNEEERKGLKITPYANGVGNVMYRMISRKTYINYLLMWLTSSWQISMAYWEPLKLMLRCLNKIIAFDLVYKW